MTYCVANRAGTAQKFKYTPQRLESGHLMSTQKNVKMPKIQCSGKFLTRLKVAASAEKA